MKNHIPEWLKTAVIYEIYPQSFYDSNGDGIGDIPGVLAKLDYIASLGCDTLWLNPCFVSPFQDAGYDIADFYRVAPRYGTNADLKRLFRSARARGLRVLLDFVAGHTSVEHPWFQASAKAKKNKYTNWFLWTDWTWENPPAGMEGIKGFGERNGQYITNFFHFQPALNYGFAHPDPKRPWQLPVNHPDVQAVRREMKNILRFWLDQGASGFRVDMAGSIMKDDTDGKERKRFWQEVRGMLERDYPEAVMISEWSHPAQAIPAGFHVDMLLPFTEPSKALLRAPTLGERVDYSQAFFHKSGRGNVQRFFAEYLKQYEATRNQGYIAVIVGNHDTVRINDRKSERELEAIFAFMLAMPGVPIVYYGDEIGMPHRRGIVSREGGYERTAARTPMQWDGSRNAGFSSAKTEKLYLSMDPDPRRTTVAKQESRATSLLQQVRKLIRLKKTLPALRADADFELLSTDEKTYPLAFLRGRGKETLLCVFNPANRPVKAEFNVKALGQMRLELVAGLGGTAESRKGKVQLVMKGMSYGIFRGE